MIIEQFVAQSEGQWRSMRSSHSLAFKQFEHVISTITVQLLDRNDPRVLALLHLANDISESHLLPFYIKWDVDTDWEQDKSNQVNTGSSILVPIPKTKTHGFLLRSQGYTEPIESVSKYYFLNDGTFIIISEYESTMTEERIWFLSKSVRCRSSVVSTKDTSGIIQTSFTSEIRLTNEKDEKVLI